MDKNLYHRLERLTRKWWFYLLLFVIPAAIPPFSTTGLGYWHQLKDFTWYVSDMVYAKKVTYAASMPLMHLLVVALFAALLYWGKRFGRAFSFLVALNFVYVAFIQSSVTTDRYGVVIISELFTWYLVALLLWLWEGVSSRNDYTWEKDRLRPYWAIPLALIAFWDPDQLWQLHLSYFVKSYAPTSFCMMTPIYLTVLLFIYPKVNILLLRVHGFIGIVIGVITLVIAFMKEPSDGFYWTLLHVPLIAISTYSFILGLRTNPHE